MSCFWKVCSYLCTQYLVGPALAWITASMRRGMEAISLWHCSGVMEAQVAFIAAFRSGVGAGVYNSIYLYGLLWVLKCCCMSEKSLWDWTRPHWQITQDALSICSQVLEVNKIPTYKSAIMALSDGGKLYRTELALVLCAEEMWTPLSAHILSQNPILSSPVTRKVARTLLCSFILNMDFT